MSDTCRKVARNHAEFLAMSWGSNGHDGGGRLIPVLPRMEEPYCCESGKVNGTPIDEALPISSLPCNCKQNPVSGLISVPLTTMRKRRLGFKQGEQYPGDTFTDLHNNRVPLSRQPHHSMLSSQLRTSVCPFRRGIS
eukprot:1141195-Pelagomonas_calceolata.AAC.4